MTFDKDSTEQCTFLERGTVALHTSKNTKELYVITHLFSSYKNDHFCFKFKPLFWNNQRIEYGICNKRDDIAEYVKLNCNINMPNYKIICKENGTENVLHDLQLPAVDSQVLNSELALDVNIDLCTTRFFVNGDQKHDVDVPIPLTRAQLKDAFFFVKLFAPGDCVRIIE